MISRMSLSSSDLNRAGKYNESSARNNALGGHQIQTPIGFGLEVRSFGNFHHKRKKDEFARLNQICEMSNTSRARSAARPRCYSYALRVRIPEQITEVHFRCIIHGLHRRGST